MPENELHGHLFVIILETPHHPETGNYIHTVEQTDEETAIKGG